ncbi:Helix-turn-helix transcriptional regulator [Candidatus Megaera polyxenophila]|nr:Helix-turn-helix transcriptional regulator [Candidatus Megaera polyxenophila]
MVRKTSQLNAIDKFIGYKIYSLRLEKGLSRQQLSKVIGITHQQLQKYENGSNRISASKLALIAKALDLRIPYFYEGFEAADNIPLETESQRLCIEVARNFRRIANREHQDAINILVKSLLKERVA